MYSLLGIPIGFCVVGWYSQHRYNNKIKNAKQLNNENRDEISNKYILTNIIAENPIIFDNKKLLMLKQNHCDVFTTLENYKTANGINSYTHEYEKSVGEVVKVVDNAKSYNELDLSNLIDKMIDDFGIKLSTTMTRSSDNSNLFNTTHDLGYVNLGIKNDRYEGRRIYNYGLPYENHKFLIIGRHNGNCFVPNNTYIYENMSFSDVCDKNYQDEKYWKYATYTFTALMCLVGGIEAKLYLNRFRN